MLLGAHCKGGVKGALAHAGEIGAEAVQLFVQSPRTWRFPDHDPAELARFKERKNMPALVHALYLLNLASPNEDFYEKSVTTLRATVDAACAIGAEAVVFHVGSHQGAGFHVGLKRAVPALAEALERCSDTTWLLMENSAGAGGTIGRSLHELAALFDALDAHPRLGICLDTCHLFVSGYDVTDAEALEALLGDVDSRIGLERLRALHVNDSQTPLGSNRDRHANVLEGLLGERLGVFLGHPKLQGLPAVLEVPGVNRSGPNADEVRKLKELHARWAPKAKKPAAKKRR